VSYRNSVETHLRPRWGRRRLDSITVDDAARLVRELRADGKAEWTISTVLRAGSRVFTFARRRLNWHGENPIAGLENGERPRVVTATRRRIFQGDELAQTLAAANEPWRTLFSLAAVTGARESELLGLLVSDVDVREVNDAAVTFTHQVDRKGERVALKTDESRRTVELPPSMAVMLLEHLARSPRKGAGAFLFATRSGRALGQRNALRELRRAQERARDRDGRPTFPDLFERNDRGELIVSDRGEYVPQRRRDVPRGTVPHFHGYRHTAASDAIAAGDGSEEISWQLGHKNSNVTRAVYVQEIKSAERRARRRAKMEDRYGAMLRATQPTQAPKGGEVVPLRSG
jgi:integrase